MRYRVENLLSARGGLVAGALALGIAYPFALERALAYVGVRPLALGLAALAALAALPRRRLAGAPRALLAACQAGGIALALAAAILGDRWPLLFVPALVQLGLAGFFLASLREPVCLVHQVARLLQPLLPDWVDSYCRKVTVAFSAFFAANAVVIAGLALAAPLSWWQLYTGVLLFALTGALLLIEFVVRKSWFRYYADGWLDRIWSALLPAENTAQGRRSMEYIRCMQAREATASPAPAAEESWPSLR